MAKVVLPTLNDEQTESNPVSDSFELLTFRKQRPVASQTMETTEPAPDSNQTELAQQKLTTTRAATTTQPRSTSVPADPIANISNNPAGEDNPNPAAPLVPLEGSALGESSSPAELVRWGLQKFSKTPSVLTTSFGMEGCALMDLCSKAIEQHKLPKLTVACIDTSFFFPETLQLKKKLVERYKNLEFVTWQTPVTVEQQSKTYGDQLWKNNPNMCCNIRKVQPMKENIKNYQLWITGLRRTQTEHRADISALGWDWKYQLLKFCPLATWSRADVWNYVQENEVPFNQLHLQNYPSISCYHCTKPVPGSNPDSEVRKGRWAGKDKDECGLHYSI